MIVIRADENVGRLDDKGQRESDSTALRCGRMDARMDELSIDREECNYGRVFRHYRGKGQLLSLPVNQSAGGERRKNKQNHSPYPIPVAVVYFQKP